MFPLPDVVLFPHALLPLHIFEPRYYDMIKDAVDGSRFIVMAQRLEPESWDEGPPPRVATIAGVGEIVLCQELPDRRFHVVLFGRGSMRIARERSTDKPYRMVSGELVPDETPTDLAALAEAESSLRALVENLADALPEGGSLLKHVAAAQHSPTELVDVMASALLVEPAERQALLENTDVLSRFEHISAAAAAMAVRVPRGDRPAN